MNDFIWDDMNWVIGCEWFLDFLNWIDGWECGVLECDFIRLKWLCILEWKDLLIRVSVGV